jgi:hypothetical protein
MDVFFISHCKKINISGTYFQALFPHSISETNKVALVLLPQQNSYISGVAILDSRKLKYATSE